MKLTGTILGFYEPGIEGVCWSLSVDGKQGYDALASIDTDDFLTIFNEDGSIAFQGKIDPDRKIGYQRALDFRVRWTQRGWQPDDWAALFLREEFGKKPLRAELEKKRFHGMLSLSINTMAPNTPPDYILVLHDLDQKQYGIPHLPIELGDRLIICDDLEKPSNGGKPIFKGVIDECPCAQKGWDGKYWQSFFDGKRRATLIKK